MSERPDHTVAQETRGDPPLAWSVASRPRGGEEHCGDRHVVQPFGGGVLVAAVDGLGHGPEAATAAQRAVQTLEQFAGEAVEDLVRRCHETLLRSRGIVITVASIDPRAMAMTWLAVGNVEGVLLRGDTQGDGRLQRMFVAGRGGVVGYQLPPLRPATLPIAPDDLLVLATDGIAGGFAESISVSDPPRTTADRVLQMYGKQDDDALILVARYVGGAP